MQLDYHEVLSKARRYCAYQERCVHDLKLKNYEWGLDREEFDKMIEELSEDNYLNEERYAEFYVRGKFNLKKWGKLKIRDGLYSKNIPEEIIEQSMLQIEDEQYVNVLKELLEKKEEQVKNEKDQKAKLQRYLLSKGFEWEWISKVMK